METVKKIVRVVLAGGLGGVVNSLALWLFGMLGITPALGFMMQPELTMPWLLPRVMQGALWGLLFLLPFWKESLYKKGLVLSLPLWLVMVLVVFPMKMQAGMFGLALGPGAPVWALFFTLVWGVVAATFLQYVWRNDAA
ncbi:MAG TPA: hypothetical protein VLL73_03200 [Desulfurivibrionaceae bacterium]|nr:hypothetical protein [Desulfurivibrionaceae bacterium]